MKKILFAFVAVISFAFTTHAQDVNGGWTTNTTGQCFCCDKFYNFPTIPPINGPTSISCDANATYTTTNCPGAAITWTVSPAKPFTGQGTSSITIAAPHNVGAYTISVTIRCGEKVIKNQIQVTVKQEKCCPDFLIALDEKPGGLYQVTATPNCPGGAYHYWILQEVASCPNGAVTGSAAGWNLFITNGVPSTSNPAITAGPTGYGYVYGGLGKGKCYRLIHYVRCCGVWKVQIKCFCLTTTLRAKMTDAELGANTETKEVTVEQLPAELRAKIGKQ